VSLLDLLMPPACAGCGRSGTLLCSACHRTLRQLDAGLDRFVAPDPGVVAGDALLLALAAFAHEGPMRRAVAALKYTGVARLAPILAHASAAVLDPLLGISGRNAKLVPVPVHAERLRARGYNQATLLARSLARERRLPVVESLVRVRPTTKQHRLNRTARLHNLGGAFAVAQSVPTPRVAILVDDILTTSATLEACASVLLQAGCEAVYGFAIAREV
jgi:ComF family protein